MRVSLPVLHRGPQPARTCRPGAAGVFAALVAVVASTSPATAANSPWWQPAGLSGRSVTRVVAGGGHVTVIVSGQAMTSTDGTTFTPAAPASVPAGPSTVTVAGDSWGVRSGRVVHARPGRPAEVDPGSPDLGAGAHLLAAPLAAPGVVVVVSEAGVVWRRARGGEWRASLVLLPRTLITGTPAVSALAAFSDRPVTGVVYLGTRGYGTLLSDNGGDDWIRAGPGLPDDVQSLAVDSSRSPPVVWAGTTEGLFVHRLQPQPSIPAYSGGDLTGKALITLGLCLLVIALATLALLRLLSSPAPDHRA